MATITIKDKPVNTIGELPAPGSKAPDFVLVKTDFTDTTLKNYEGETVVLNIFPSIDTTVCSASVRRFNQEISNYPGAVVICASLDLPFAHARFCEAEGLKEVIPASAFRNSEFGTSYGVRMTDGPLKGLFARAVIVVNTTGKITYSKMIRELTNEPDYEEVLAVLNKQNADGCTTTDTAEHTRFSDQDEPCDDGRAG